MSEHEDDLEVQEVALPSFMKDYVKKQIPPDKWRSHAVASVQWSFSLLRGVFIATLWNAPKCCTQRQLQAFSFRIDGA